MASEDKVFGSSELKYLNYVDRFKEEIPDLFKESEIYKSVVIGVLEELDEQQKVLIWLSQNLLNLDEAKGSHLDLIGNFVGQKRLLASFETGINFGFEGAYQSGTFGDKNNPNVGAEWLDNNSFRESTSKVLNDEQYRRVIKARICKNNAIFCSVDEILEVVNYLCGNTSSSLSMTSHGNLDIKVNDQDGFLSYFINRQNTLDNILPIPLGVRFKIVE